MPLAADRNTPMKDAELIGVSVAANAKIFAGALVVANAAGYPGKFFWLPRGCATDVSRFDR